MATTSVSARFQELFPETNLISLLTKYGGDADDIFETIQDRYDAHEQEPLVGLLGIKAANIDAFARAAYWDLVSDIRVRYLSSLPRSEAAAIFARLLADKNGDTISTAANTKFTDIPAHAWYSGYVKYLNNNGVTYGKSGNTFAPDDAITRAEFTTLAVRFFDVYGDGNKDIMEQYKDFGDVGDGYWAAEYIKAAAKSGWINGYEDGSFRADRNISRAEVVTIVNRLLGREADESYIADNLRKLNTFRDMSGKHWAYYAVMEAANAHTSILGENETWSK